MRSITGPERGRVVAKPRQILIHDVSFRIQKAGQERARREGRRNVHAFARGAVDLDSGIGNVVSDPAVVRISYNPHRDATFVRVDTGSAVHHARTVAIDGKTVYAILEEI